MEAALSPDVATEQLAQEIGEATRELLRLVAEEPDRPWPAYELKDRARNGWSAGATDIALNRLIDTGRFEIDGDLIRIRH